MSQAPLQQGPQLLSELPVAVGQGPPHTEALCILPYLLPSFFPFQETAKAPRWEVAGQLKCNQNN